MLFTLLLAIFWNFPFIFFLFLCLLIFYFVHPGRCFLLRCCLKTSLFRVYSFIQLKLITYFAAVQAFMVLILQLPRTLYYEGWSILYSIVLKSFSMLFLDLLRVFSGVFLLACWFLLDISYYVGM